MTADIKTLTPLVVRRSPWRGWGWALVGIPFLVIAVDVLFTRFFTNRLLEIIYSTAAETEGTIEIRDYIFASVFLVAGGGMVAYGLKELVAPGWVILGDDLGIEVRSGPFGTPLRYRWEDLGVIEERQIDIDGVLHEMVHIGGVETNGPEPWGARWSQPDGIDVFAEGWADPPAEVVERLNQMRERATAVTVIEPPSSNEDQSSPGDEEEAETTEEE